MSIRTQAEELCARYGFRVVDACASEGILARDFLGNANEFVIQGMSIDGRWADWMGYGTAQGEVAVCLNDTDNNNMWLYETRPDLSAEDIVEFTACIGRLFELDDFSVSAIVDPEDWQEIAKVPNAYDDVRFSLPANRF